MERSPGGTDPFFGTHSQGFPSQSTSKLKDDQTSLSPSLPLPSPPLQELLPCLCSPSQTSISTDVYTGDIHSVTSRLLCNPPQSGFCPCHSLHQHSLAKVILTSRWQNAEVTVTCQSSDPTRSPPPSFWKERLLWGFMA